MTQHRSRLTPAIALLALLAATPALPQAHRSTAPRTSSFSEIVRSFLPAFLTQLWNSTTGIDSGCGADPFGGHCAKAVARPPLPTVTGDSGCVIDPFGRCAT
jgi:hypothetical protein